MDVEYPETHGFGDRATERIVTASVVDFAVDVLFYRETGWPNGSSKHRIGLENQPTEICKAMGRLLNVLLDKGLMTEEEFHEVIGTDYNLREKSKLKKEQNG